MYDMAMPVKEIKFGKQELQDTLDWGGSQTTSNQIILEGVEVFTQRLVDQALVLAIWSSDFEGVDHTPHIL